MDFSSIIFVICFYIFQYIDCQKILLIREQEQNDIEKWFDDHLKNFKTPEISFELSTITITDDDNDETIESKVCSHPDEITLIIDATWTNDWKISKNSRNIPYLKIDLSAITPFVILLDEYLDARNSTDVVLILDKPDYVNELIFYWIDTRQMRMVISEKLDETVIKKIKNLRPIPNNFALVSSTNNMNTNFRKVLKENLVTLPERWNLVFTDFEYENFDTTLIDGKPINLLKLHQKICCSFINYNSDDETQCKCPENFNLPYNFLGYLLKNIHETYSKLKTQEVVLETKIDCEISKSNEALKSFTEFPKEYVYTHRNVLRPKTHGSVEINEEIIAEFDLENGIRANQNKLIKPIKPYYRIGVTHAIPWSFKETNTIGETYWTGYCVDFTYKLSELMNFDFEFIEPAHGTFGEKINGTWNGIVGDLQKGETDIAITALVMTADKEEVIDFVPPYFEQTGISLVMRKPVRKTSLFKFMTVLKLEVWLSIVGALILTGFSIWFLDKYSPYSARNNKKSYPYPCREFTLKESFWFALTSFTPQGGGEAPKSLSGRTLVAAYWLFVVLMLATFTANLAAFLTVERMQAPVQSLEQLSRQSRINYTVVESSEVHEYFINMKNAEDTLYRMWKELTLNASIDDKQYRVWDYPIKEQYGHILIAINDSNPVPNAAKGFELVNEHVDGDFAFIHDSSEIKYEVSKNCNLTEVGEVFAEKPYAIAVQQGSHLTDDLSRAILTLQNNRFFDEIHAKYWNESAKINCPNTDDNEGITLQSLGGVFIATLFGLALAMITLIGEILYYRNKRKDIIKPKPSNVSKNIKLIQPETITIGTKFKPISSNFPTNSDLIQPPITLYPRSRKVDTSS